jgi:hypothetical protein
MISGAPLFQYFFFLGMTAGNLWGAATIHFFMNALVSGSFILFRAAGCIP